MSVTIRIEHALKQFGANTVIPDLSLQIREGEFFTLLGPSGCGKTTLLRMIAGFNTIEGGNFYFNDKLINDLDPAKRNIGMVFQNYAIFPHLTVRKNVEFGLENRKMGKAEKAALSDEFMKLVHVDEYADRIYVPKVVRSAPSTVACNDAVGVGTADGGGGIAQHRRACGKVVIGRAQINRHGQFHSRYLQHTDDLIFNTVSGQVGGGFFAGFKVGEIALLFCVKLPVVLL